MRSKERIAYDLWYGSLSGLMNDRVDSDDFFDFSKELSTELDEYAKEMAIEFGKWIDDIGYCKVDSDSGMRWESWSDLSGKSDEELYNSFLFSFTNKNKSPMTREQEPKDVKPEDHGKHPVSKPTVDEPTTQGTTWGDGTDENPKPPLPPTPPPQP